VSQIGNLNDPNTLLNLNSPDIKHKISDGFTDSVAKLPAPARAQATIQFSDAQSDYSNKVVSAFSGSLQRIFLVSATLMFLAAILVFSIKEKPLRAASPQASPGVE
jgi:hypothetical protein